jgi:signal transduction histidine kinase
VLVNLVNNAVKNAPDSKEIIIYVDDLEDSVKVSVIDKGKGISAEYVPYLFDRYYRVNENRNQGSGLGWDYIFPRKLFVNTGVRSV